MAKQISATSYTNRKGAERVGLQMSKADAIALLADEPNDAWAAVQAELTDALAAVLTEQDGQES